jgi:DNA end-binding protein Ku
MHPLWKGAISFGLVNIPVSLYSGIRRDETIHFHLLRKSDRSRVHNKRVSEADDEEVPWDEITKGYEYQKGKYVEMTEEEMDEIGLKSTRVIEIEAFVKLEEIDPVYFDTPYLIQADPSGEKPYRLLVEVLDQTKTAAIAKVVLRGGREHLVALLARDNRLVADMLHFHAELQPMDLVTAPQVKINDREREIARKLVESMRTKWKPEIYHDEYEKALKDLIHRKLAGKTIRTPKEKKTGRPDNVIDLVEILQKSLREKGGEPEVKSKSKSRATQAKSKAVTASKRRRAA